eukprot:CAMPEP_0183417960 /NCGR_PEP_ID=MMETSP0370-20130417/24788_1 /TAXON_ID=268820 /ORGANISM="Peridinium aciculiferum, Strain PAER-2" /LENGTH=69 /DNA_ID=CAMNT_0025601605 /DNA_START=35 /DNA_END=241 /DNA_ORIENTATION=-
MVKQPGSFAAQLCSPSAPSAPRPATGLPSAMPSEGRGGVVRASAWSITSPRVESEASFGGAVSPGPASE